MHIGAAFKLNAICVYGGAPYGDQERALRAGCDIVVGTPGRMKDHLERKTLSFEKLRFRVLDEADEMLNMGFVEDIETILNAAKDNDKLQTLLFSATLPKWVADIARRFLTRDTPPWTSWATRSRRRRAACNTCCCRASGASAHRTSLRSDSREGARRRSRHCVLRHEA